MNLAVFLSCLVLVGVSRADSCWETGCQPNSWAVKGCGQYSLTEGGRTACPDGFKYLCCPNAAPAPAPAPAPTTETSACKCLFYICFVYVGTMMHKIHRRINTCLKIHFFSISSGHHVQPILSSCDFQWLPCTYPRQV